MAASKVDWFNRIGVIGSFVFSGQIQRPHVGQVHTEMFDFYSLT